MNLNEAQTIKKHQVKPKHQHNSPGPTIRAVVVPAVHRCWHIARRVILGVLLLSHLLAGESSHNVTCRWTITTVRTHPGDKAHPVPLAAAPALPPTVSSGAEAARVHHRRPVATQGRTVSVSVLSDFYLKRFLGWCLFLVSCPTLPWSISYAGFHFSGAEKALFLWSKPLLRSLKNCCTCEISVD